MGKDVINEHYDKCSVQERIIRFLEVSKVILPLMRSIFVPHSHSTVMYMFSSKILESYPHFEFIFSFLLIGELTFASVAWAMLFC
jgi:hypothetical protein